MGFTKLDDNLDGSSIFREPDAVFKVWMLILSKTRSDGLAPISADYIVSITRKPDDEVDRCLEVLMAPDPKSRSQNDEGRRIRRVDGGFYVINYAKYRDRERTYSDSPDAIRMRKKRAEALNEDEQKRTCSNSSASASPSQIEGGVGETSQTTEAVRLVFAYWQAVMGKPKAKLTGDRERRIKARIREGYTVDDLKAAVAGCKASAWHQGANADAKVWDDLELICRDGKHVEQFMGEKPEPEPAKPEPKVAPWDRYK